MSQQRMPKAKVKVLYQRLGDTWYAFTEVDNEVFVGRVPLTQELSSDKAETAPKALLDAIAQEKALAEQKKSGKSSKKQSPAA